MDQRAKRRGVLLALIGEWWVYISVQVHISGDICPGNEIAAVIAAAPDRLLALL